MKKNLQRGWIIFGALMLEIIVLTNSNAMAQATTCDPACRRGYFCKSGVCVSQCNPPCGSGETCVDGDCELISSKKAKRNAESFDSNVAFAGGGKFALSDAAASEGGFHLELGSTYGALQIGPMFGDGVTTLRTAMMIQVPFRPSSLPLYLIPTISLGYAFGWVKDAVNTHLQDIFITPGLRVRYHLHPRFAVFVDPVKIEISFLRLQSSTIQDITRVDAVPVHYGLSCGVALFY